MRRFQLSAIIVAVAAAGPAAAKQDAKSIPVTVVDQAGSTVFIEPGEESGIRPGQTIRLGKAEYRVKAVTGTHAMIDVGDRVLQIGSRGRARIVQRVAENGRLAPPAPLQTFEGQWPEVVLPADTQDPTPVPIGPIRPGGNNEVTLRASSSSLFPLEEGDAVSHVSLRAQVRSEPFSETPFGIDADVEAGRWFGRGLNRDLGASSRPSVEVQELRLRYGERSDPVLGLGRLRYASSAVGLLDGVRTAAHVGVFTIFAFGGLVPETLDGTPSTRLSRFGTGAAYRDRRNDWRPDAEVTAYGSVFEGTLDERRFAGHLRLSPGPLTMGARAELSAYSPNNPWGANRVELTAGGVDVGAHNERYQLQFSVDALGAERSRWLASLLPPSWLCTAEPAPPGSVEACDGSREIRYYGLATAGADFSHLALRLGGTAVADDGVDIEERGGFADVHLLDLLPLVDFDLGGMVSRAAFVDTYSVRAGAAAPVFRSLDASLYYRPSVLSYQAAVENYLEHRVGAELYYSPRPAWGLRASSDAVFGQDVSVVGAFLTAVWRSSL